MRRAGAVARFPVTRLNPGLRVQWHEFCVQFARGEVIPHSSRHRNALNTGVTMKAGSLIGYGVAFLCMMSIGALVFSRFAPNGMAFAGEHASALQRAARIDANYLTTGAVSEQVEAMRLLAPNFNLRMSFASSGSDFGPGDVRVAIQNEHGDAIIDTVADGPLFYANLPSGLYRVTIRANGETLIRIVNLGAGRKASLRFYWPSTQLTLLRGMRG